MQSEPRAAATAAVAAALEDAAQLGLFFAVEQIAEGPGWAPMAELCDRPDVLIERIAATRSALALTAGVDATQVEPRVAASITLLGLVARLISPALGAAVCSGLVPSMSLAELRWQAGLGGPVPLALTIPAGMYGSDPAVAAGLLDDLVLTPSVAPLIQLTQDRLDVSPTVLWGNAASALAGAAVMISRTRPEFCDRAQAILKALLQRPVLAGAGEVGPRGPGDIPRFRRNSCCLYYRIPGAGICGDCILQRA